MIRQSGHCLEAHATSGYYSGVTTRFAVAANYMQQRNDMRAFNIPGAGLLLQPEVSHFSFLQDSEQFNSDVLHFLDHVKER